jgi:predicted acylesterase/phospholipase RssA
MRAITQFMIVSLAALLLLVACARPEIRPPEDPDLRNVTPQDSVTLYDDATGRPAEATVADVRPGERLEILALSGGGADGAFGAGVLKGWTESGHRPRFDIVTGVSTGALTSIFAFLGPRYDETLRRLYTSVDTARIFRTKGLIAGVTSSSLLDNEPLKKEVEKALTPALLDEIAREHEKGRRLYVGTTNLDAGRLVVWDIGAIAASRHPRRKEVIRDILLASAAVPAFFRPVYIRPLKAAKGRQMHVDGSIKSPFVLEPFMLRPSAPRGKAVYVIINSWVRLSDNSGAVRPQTVDIAARSLSELMRGAMQQQLYRAYVMARNAGARFYMMAIPDEGPGSNNALDFDTARMKALYETGRRLGRAGRWQQEPPRLSSAERVPASRKTATSKSR